MYPDSRFPIPDSHVNRVSGLVAALLTLVYAATLAPTVTLWDAGEFNAAIASLGIPHPPGTPLYILIARVWSDLLGPVSQALAVNLLSAIATALACGLLGGLMTRWTQSRLAGVAGGLAAGTMLAVWLNATETEVYACSMLLAVLMVAVGDRAGARDSTRLRLLLAYLMALAVPLQISALVAAPAAILLASTGPDDVRPDPRRLGALGGVLAIVAGAGLVSPLLAAGGAILLLGSALGRGAATGARRDAAGLAAVLVVGVSATLFLLVRAPHDPFLNQGNPSTIDALLNVVARTQYPLPGLWPRQAPVWVQLLSFVQYADWQVASGLDSSVSASWWRTPWSVGALLLAGVGARWLRQRDARGARGAGVLFVMASLGVVAVLNLRAGSSILDTVLPPGAPHEPRERDYFFALAFAVAGAWAGAGAVVAARRWLPTGAPRLVTAVALATAGLPMLLNWQAATRRPDAMLATTFGEALLASAPPNAVLLVAGDNDSYTTWYRQAVLGERRDVVPVTLPLLPADWYRAELERRHGLMEPEAVSSWRGEAETLRALVAGARRNGRPVAAAVSVPVAVRQAVAPAWTLGGMAYVASFDSISASDRVDTAATRSIAELIASRTPAASRRGDPASAYVARILRCPSEALLLGSDRPGSAPGLLLDSRCNLK
jgi:hypothetical protein